MKENRKYQVEAVTAIDELLPVADAMVRKGVDKNYGSWNDMTIGESWNLGNYFEDAQAYIKFDLSQYEKLSERVVESAHLELFQYVRSDYAAGEYIVNVAKVGGRWDEMNINWSNKPDLTGVYSKVSVKGEAGQWFNPPRKYSFDITSLVMKWLGDGENNGLALYKTSGNLGGFWCSRNFNNSTCFDSTQPKLVIKYRMNQSPYIPDIVSPLPYENFYYKFSDTGVTIDMKINNVGDPDGNLDGTWFYYKMEGDENWVESEKQVGYGFISLKKFFNEGLWHWRARSCDKNGLCGDFSRGGTFIVKEILPSETQASEIDTSSWGKYSGIYSRSGIPSKGRLKKGYVINTSMFDIKGDAKRGSSVEFLIDSNISGKLEMSGDDCIFDREKIPILYGAYCRWNYIVKLGIDEKWYELKTKVTSIDGAKSVDSKSVFVFYDKTSPKKPSILKGEGYSKNKNSYITRNLRIKLRGKAEKLSDIVVRIKRNGKLKGEYISIADSKGTWMKSIKVGKKRGKKDDGNYKISVLSVDASGNKSSSSEIKMLRDTVAPMPPVVSEPYICGDKICVKVSGENNGRLYVNEKYIGKLERKSHALVIRKSWKHSTTYSFDFFQKDLASNKSKKVVRMITMPNKPIGDVDIKKTEDPWNEKSNKDLGSVKMNVFINSDGFYQIQDLDIPTPKITKIYTNENDKVEIYGVSSPKYEKISADIVKEYKSYKEAADICDVGFIIDSGERKCMEKYMGIKNLMKWSVSISSNCNYWPPCIEEKKNYHNVKVFKNINTKVEHSMTAFYEHKKKNRYISSLWNDSCDGRFKKKLKLGKDVDVGDYIKTATIIYGDFYFDGTKIDYRGRNPEEAVKGGGLGSEFSNKVKVPKKPFIFDVAVSPVSDSSCGDTYVSSNYGKRKHPITGEISFHSGIDIARVGGGSCKIVAVYKGQASTMWYAGMSVAIKHDSIYETKYGHTEQYIGEYPRKVKKKEAVM